MSISRLYSQAAFTFVELLSVIGTIGVLSANSIPLYANVSSLSVETLLESQANDARTALEAGSTKSDKSSPSGPVFVSLNTPGPVSDPAVSSLLPGLVLGSNLKLSLLYDPACEAAGSAPSCMHTYIQVVNCRYRTVLTKIYRKDLQASSTFRFLPSEQSTYCS